MGYWAISSSEGAIKAAELLSNVERAELTVESLGKPHDEATVDWPHHSFAVVMSQDCDLEWDYSARQRLQELGKPPPHGDARDLWNQQDAKARTKLMTMALLCQADLAEDVRRRSGLPHAEWKWATGNQHERYHLLHALPAGEDLTGEGVDQLVLDFKRFFALPITELTARVKLEAGTVGCATRRAAITSPHKEEVLLRFYNYQARVAVPEAMGAATAMLQADAGKV